MSTDSFRLPLGFETAGVKCGIKASGLPDLSLFVSNSPAVAAGVFTQNQVVGAPVLVSRERVPGTNLRAVVINSGNANACTSERGIDDAKRMASIVGEQIDASGDSVLVCSTGVIGHFLPMEKVQKGIELAAQELGASPAHLEASAKGIMTTDTVEKIVTLSLEIQGKTVTITGVAKGAAMIAPNMATMLSVIMTDCHIAPEVVTALLKSAVNSSFNCISVEGHTSTSDTVLLLANGQSGVRCDDDESIAMFRDGLTEVCQALSQKIIRDAEGAGHFVSVEVTGLPETQDARRIAKAVCDSPLVKTAITGNDPNWGRIISAAGYAGVPFLERDLSLVLNGVAIYESGRPAAFDETALSQSMASGEVTIRLEFRLGNASIQYWTCDLTSEYIRLNADYTT